MTDQMSIPVDDQIFDVDGLRAYLKLPTRPAVYERHARGTLPPAIRLGRALRWRKRDVDAWLAARAASTSTL